MSDESYIKLTLELAKKGAGNVSPNPLVGCVIIKNEKIIGAGYHEEYGGNHAEVNAINSARESVEGATLYVNLEPCSHFGKTPPCVDKIIESRIGKVVIGTLDMNPLVSGKGIKKLKAAGLEVSVGKLEKDCIELNKFFFKYITKNLPYVSLKAAQTLDGKIADFKGDSRWISSTLSRKHVHLLRSRYDAVLVGAGTIRTDNPRLTVRLMEGRNPKRIILNSKLNLSTKHRIFTDNGDKNLIVVTSRNNLSKKAKLKKLTDLGVTIIFAKENANGLINLKSALSELAKHQITSILVEGGSEVYSSFIKEKLYDNILLFIAPKFLGNGIPFANINESGILKNAEKFKSINVETYDSDLLVELSR
ncbi:MAG: bifunctional diaminohydroxyphosphoribosylaminopyrimidine deaminase/5-amino-6-(5-phosphoribosylamino)uracil reductase RibD [Ignavibacteriaceae bacterium]|nr:bifunctional diaminohydroxyphosphoribosylaminopyrimidine deaminase/5-amino-6-(5-phosphoribosylamino)uracil reductase RibD [Ignavibacteriaceae bacterium]